MAECLPIQVATVVEPLSGGIEMTGVGSANTGAAAAASLTYSVAVEEGLLVVSVECFDSVTASAPTSVTYSGTPMVLAASAISGSGFYKPSVFIYTLPVLNSSGNVVIDPAGATTIMQSQAWNVTGLVENEVTGFAATTGTTETYITPGPLSTTDDQAMIAVFSIVESSAETFTWGGLFVAGSQSISVTIGADILASIEGRRIVDTTGVYLPSVTTSSGSHVSWAGAAVAVN